jgi:transcriptional regulator GlxA family with amidase domain
MKQSSSTRRQSKLYRCKPGTHLSLLALLRDELASKGPIDAELVRALVKGFVLYVTRSENGAANDEHPMDRRIARAIALIHAEPGRRWTVEELARAVGLSRPSFARQFLRHGGTSPARYLATVRLDLAAELLRGSDAGLAEIAAQVGYDSEFAFNRAFKRHHGVAPGVFRRSGATFGLTVRAAA